jgi:hypothetical protein
LAGGFLVHVPEDVEADDDHGYAESNEAMGWAEEWPVASEVGFEEGAFGDNEEDWMWR